MAERFRVLEWLPDDPYPRAAVESWPDEPGATVDVDAHRRQSRTGMIALFERIASAQGARRCRRGSSCSASRSLATTRECGCTRWQSRVPMGQADRYSVLAAPSAAARLDALRDAVETVAAMVEFQLADGGSAD